MCTCIMYILFCIFASTAAAAGGLPSRFRLRDTQGARRYITTHVWDPAELLGAFSGGPTS